MSYSFLFDPIGDALLFKFGTNEKESYGETVAEDTRILHYNQWEQLLCGHVPLHLRGV